MDGREQQSDQDLRSTVRRSPRARARATSADVRLGGALSLQRGAPRIMGTLGGAWEEGRRVGQGTRTILGLI